MPNLRNGSKAGVEPSIAAVSTSPSSSLKVTNTIVTLTLLMLSTIESQDYNPASAYGLIGVF